MVPPRLGFVALVAVIFAAAEGAASQNVAVQDTLAAKRVRQWLTAVEEHQPGRADDALDRIRTWTDDQLRVLSQDLARLLRTRNPPVETSWLKLDVPENRARVLRRGAMLHADIAMLAPLNISRRGVQSGQVGGVQVDDGLGMGITAPAAHWILGRYLIDALAGTDRTPDEFVDRWFRATTAAMLASGDYASVESHLIHAQRLLPTRAHVWLSTGVMHASFAAPAVQNASATLKLPEGFILRVRGEQRELELAEESFRRAIALEPDNAEARLRLGRVLAQQERHEDALRELRVAGAAAQEPIQQYYVCVFSGQAAGELGQVDLAHDAFTRAAALYPDAQTPMLGLSELAVRRGDRSAAVAALQRLQTTGDSFAGPDPWWTYDRSYARDAARLAADLHNWFAGERR